MTPCCYPLDETEANNAPFQGRSAAKIYIRQMKESGASRPLCNSEILRGILFWIQGR